MGRGSNDSAGKDWQFRIDRGGSAVALRGTDKIDMKPGDCFIIETPDGGGFGQPAVSKAAE